MVVDEYLVYICCSSEDRLSVGPHASVAVTARSEGDYQRVSPETWCVSALNTAPPTVRSLASEVDDSSVGHATSSGEKLEIAINSTRSAHAQSKIRGFGSDYSWRFTGNSVCSVRICESRPATRDRYLEGASSSPFHRKLGVPDPLSHSARRTQFDGISPETRCGWL